MDPQFQLMCVHLYQSVHFLDEDYEY